MINAAIRELAGDRGTEPSNLTKCVVFLFELAPDNPPFIPPITRSYVDWFRGEKGCQVIRSLLQMPWMSAWALLTQIHTPSGFPKKSELAHFRAHLSHLSLPGIFKWERGKAQEKLYDLGANEKVLRGSHCRRYEQRLTAFIDHVSEIRRQEDTCREVIRVSHGGDHAFLIKRASIRITPNLVDPLAPVLDRLTPDTNRKIAQWDRIPKRKSGGNRRILSSGFKQLTNISIQFRLASWVFVQSRRPSPAPPHSETTILPRKISLPLASLEFSKHFVGIYIYKDEKNCLESGEIKVE